MTFHKNLLSNTYHIISTIAIIVLVVLLVRCKKENFCACRNMTSKKCPSPELLTNLYNSGKLTEYTDRDKFQKEYPPHWKNIMPDDIFEAQMKNRWTNLNKYEKSKW
jgi:hypothetical protein